MSELTDKEKIGGLQKLDLEHVNTITALESQLADTQDELKHGNFLCAKLTDKVNDLESENKRLREALEKIKSVKLDPELGQIVYSEHYEDAWLHCYEIAQSALDGGKPCM